MREFVSHRCGVVGCKAAGTKESGYEEWLVMEAPGDNYVRYFVCPECRVMLMSDEEKQYASRYPEETATEEVEG